MKIEHLINDTYQVSDDGTTWFQGGLTDCKAYVKLHEGDSNKAIDEILDSISEVDQLRISNQMLKQALDEADKTIKELKQK